MGESKIRKCIICGRLITASRRYAYCSDECAGYVLAKSVLEQKCVKYKRNIENLLQRPGKRKI
nr:MAG TPA: DNA gyrase subunit A [Caudoviricetes sp.]